MMQTSRLFFPALLLVLYSLNQCVQNQIRPRSDFKDRRHLGRWLGSDSSGRRGSLSLYSNGFASFSVTGRRFGGRALTKKGALLYQIDYSGEPIKLDLIGVNSNYQEHLRIRMIIKFLSRRRMRACTFMNERRPEGFDIKNKCYIISLRKR